MRIARRASNAGIVTLLGLSSLVSVGFFLVGAVNTRVWTDWYLIWNLVLAWLPLLFAVWLVRTLPRWPWLSWRPLILTALWLLFLPNSFYIVSDVIHLTDFVRVNPLFDIVTFESFVLNGLLIGYLSVFMIHEQLRRRISARLSTWLVGLTLLVCSFAIYLGRDLRLNSWDVVFNPAGILFDISETFINFRNHHQAFTMTLTFFVLLATFYFIAYRIAVEFMRHQASE